MMGRKAVFPFSLKAKQGKHDGPTFYILFIPIIFIKRTRKNCFAYYIRSKKKIETQADRYIDSRP